MSAERTFLSCVAHLKQNVGNSYAKLSHFSISLNHDRTRPNGYIRNYTPIIYGLHLIGLFRKFINSSSKWCNLSIYPKFRNWAYFKMA